MATRKLTKRQIDDMRGLRAQGMTYADIARAMDCTINDAYAICKDIVSVAPRAKCRHCGTEFPWTEASGNRKWCDTVDCQAHKFATMSSQRKGNAGKMTADRKAARAALAHAVRAQIIASIKAKHSYEQMAEELLFIQDDYKLKALLDRSTLSKDWTTAVRDVSYELTGNLKVGGHIVGLVFALGRKRTEFK